MSKINQAIHEIHYLDEMAQRKIWINELAPLAKVLVTLWYLVLVMSFPKYNLLGLAGMCLYPVMLSILGELPVLRAFHRLRYVLLAICLVGIANPIFDREIVIPLGGIGVTGGMISMVTLILKAGFGVFASYLLIETTTIEQICYALRQLHFPKILVTLILLIYRYVILMLKETERITQAYSLRAPGQKGIHYKVWGSLAGQMLLRTMDQAQLVYESMTLRGFQGEFPMSGGKEKRRNSIIYGVVVGLLLLLLRFVSVFGVVGRIFS